MTRSIFLAAVLALATPPPQTPMPWNGRPMDVRVTMTTSRKVYDGVYSRSNVARVCGEVPAEYNFASVKVFLVEFPDDLAPGQITDVRFDSKELVGGVTATRQFYLSLALHSPAIGSPPTYVLDTTRPKNTGSATLERQKDGTEVITVQGVNDQGQTTATVITCRAKPK